MKKVHFLLFVCSIISINFVVLSSDSPFDSSIEYGPGQYTPGHEYRDGNESPSFFVPQYVPDNTRMHGGINPQWTAKYDDRPIVDEQGRVLMKFEIEALAKLRKKVQLLIDKFGLPEALKILEKDELTDEEFRYIDAVYDVIADDKKFDKKRQNKLWTIFKEKLEAENNPNYEG